MSRGSSKRYSWNISKPGRDAICEVTGSAHDVDLSWSQLELVTFRLQAGCTITPELHGTEKSNTIQKPTGTKTKQSNCFGTQWLIY